MQQNLKSRHTLLTENDQLRRKLKVKTDKIKTLNKHIKQLEKFIDERMWVHGREKI